MTRATPRRSARRVDTQGVLGAARLRVLISALLGVLACIAPTSARADSQRALFERANQAYARGDYAAAARVYEQLVESGVADPDVCYDLGLTYAKLDAHGRAILWFERALVLAPSDAAAEAGVAASSATLGRRRADAQGETTVRSRPPFREAAVRGVHVDTLAVLVLMCSVLFFGVLGALRFARGETLRLALWIAAPLLGVGLCVASLALAQKLGVFDRGAPAIVIVDGSALREAPDPRAASRSAVHEGERARVLARDRGWSLLSLDGAREGWLRSDAVGELHVDDR